MTIAGIQIEVERKKIKHTHLAIYPPDARVHVSAPDDLSDRDLRSFLASKIGWIRDQRKTVLSQPRQTRREYVSGESIYCLGRRYKLLVVVEDRYATEKVTWGGNKLSLYVREGASQAMLGESLADKMKGWCRKLKLALPETEIRKMKTRWASCLKKRGKIVFNAALGRVPARCIEYVVVHELTHFEVSNHSRAFVELMDRRLPRWRILRKELNDFIAMPMEEV